MALVQKLAAARTAMRGHVQRAAALIARTIGAEARAALPGVRQTVKHVGRVLGITPDAGFHAGRYSPVLLIAVALAESAHAPLLRGARGSVGSNPLVALKQTEDKTPDALPKKKADMHGPAFPDQFLADEKNKKNDPEDPLKSLKLLVDPELFHGVHDDLMLPGDEYLINGGEGGFSPPDDVIWNPVVHGGMIDGGGGGGFSGGGGGAGGSGSGGGGGTGDGGGGTDGGGGNAGIQTPIVNGGTAAAVVAVPEPGCICILLCGSLLLGRRGSRRRL